MYYSSIQQDYDSGAKYESSSSQSTRCSPCMNCGKCNGCI